MVKLTFNFSRFYSLNYFHFGEKHSISVSVQLRKQNYCELWDKGFSIRIRSWDSTGLKVEEGRDQWSHQPVNHRRSQSYQLL